MDMKPKHRARDIVAHPLPVRPSRYRTALEAAREAKANPPRVETVLDAARRRAQKKDQK